MGDTVAVIGAGPAGLTAAYELGKRGVRVEVFEAQERVGGMAASFPLWGQTVDLGPHRFFSTDPRVNQIWLEVVGDRYRMVDRLTRIYYRGTFFDYPLNAGNALAGLGPIEAARCVASYAVERARAAAWPARDQTTFEGWVVSRFGRRLFEIFFKAYSEKLWGIGCDELDAAFAAQRIRKLSLFEALTAAVVAKTSTQHKTLVDRFAYPRAGTGSVYVAMAERVRAQGGQIHLGARVRAARADRGELELASGEVRRFAHIVSSMPITALVARMDPPADVAAHLAELRFRSTILVYLEVEGQDVFPDQWIYVHAPELGFGRVTNFASWLPELRGTSANSILCLEYWCQEDEPLFATEPARLVERATRELGPTGLLGGRRVLQGKVIRLPKSYPVYRRRFAEHLRPVERFLSKFDRLSAIGRYGAFKYNNQDHSILMGLLAAENIAEGKRHDLWATNSDDEYQEGALITETGLERIAR